MVESAQADPIAIRPASRRPTDARSASRGSPPPCRAPEGRPGPLRSAGDALTTTSRRGGQAAFQLSYAVLKLRDISGSASMASKISVSLSRIDRPEIRQEPGDRNSVQLDCVVANDAQLGHVGRPTGFCGTLITVPSRSSTKQWKIVLSAVGAQYPQPNIWGCVRRHAVAPGGAGRGGRGFVRGDEGGALRDTPKEVHARLTPALKGAGRSLNGFGIGGCGRLRQ